MSYSISRTIANKSIYQISPKRLTERVIARKIQTESESKISISTMTTPEQHQQNINNLINQGNDYRAKHQPIQALECYARAFLADPDCSAAWNNYGNVMRECGQPRRSIPFLQEAIAIEPDSSVANFNLAVAYLLMGDYERGWKQYESRWNYEHLAGTLPKFTQPRWTGEDLKDKTILITGEQGHGDTIQFVRYVHKLREMGAKIKIQCTIPVIPLLKACMPIEEFYRFDEVPTGFDYWVPIMSIPGIVGTTLENLELVQQYLVPDRHSIAVWNERLGPKKKLRIGFCWSGRPDAWLNEHKGMKFETMLEFVRAHPEHEWISLQVEASPEKNALLEEAGARIFYDSIKDFSDTAGLMHHLDVVLSVDTSVAHLAGALGRPTWVMLQWFALDWRWLTERKDSPWYKTAKLFRQPRMGDWDSVLKEVEKFLSWFKI